MRKFKYTYTIARTGFFVQNIAVIALKSLQNENCVLKWFCIHKRGDNMNTKTLCVSMSIFLTACASDPVQDYQEAQERELKHKTEIMESTLADAPQWYLSPPKSDINGVYATATASSSDLQYSRELAIFQAEYAIAKTINNEVSGKERQHRSQSGGVFRSTADQTIVKRVAGADVLGYRVVSQEFRIENGLYTSYVLLHMPYDMQQKMIDSRDNSFKNTADAQYRDVETFQPAVTVGVE